MHEKDFDPSTATEEELASMFNLRDQQSYDPRSMEEIQEEQRQREYARKMAKQAVDAGIIKPKMKEQ